MIDFDFLSFLLVLSSSFILAISAGWALLKFYDVMKMRKRIRQLESKTQTRDPIQEISRPRRKPGMLRRVFAELRPYSPSIVVLLAISLSAIPITLITPLPIKLI